MGGHHCKGEKKVSPPQWMTVILSPAKWYVYL